MISAAGIQRQLAKRGSLDAKQLLSLKQPAEPPGILAPLALQPTPLSEADHVVYQACCQQGLGQPVRGALIRRHCQQVHIRADIPVAT